jgi:hypothetical protein
MVRTKTVPHACSLAQMQQNRLDSNEIDAGNLEIYR